MLESNEIWVTEIYRFEYSGCPKTGRPVFGFFEKRPVDKPPVIGLSSDNRTNLSGFQTSGSYLYTALNRMF